MCPKGNAYVFMFKSINYDVWYLNYTLFIICLLFARHCTVTIKAYYVVSSVSHADGQRFPRSMNMCQLEHIP